MDLQHREDSDTKTSNKHDQTVRVLVRSHYTTVRPLVVKSSSLTVDKNPPVTECLIKRRVGNLQI